jgi:hypothetical protein
MLATRCRYRRNGSIFEWEIVRPLVILSVVLVVAVTACTEPATVPHAPTTQTPTASPTVVPTPTLSSVSQASPAPPLRPTMEESGAFMIQLQSRQFIPEAEVESGLDWLQTLPASRVHVLLQLYRPPDSTTREQLEKSGIQLLDYIPSNAWFASVPRTFRIDDPAIPMIRWLGPVLPEDKLLAKLSEGSIGTWALREGDRVALEVSFFEDVSLQDGEQVIQKHRGIVTGSTPLSNKLTVEVSKDAILLLAAEDNVRWIDLVPPPPTRDSEGG